MARCYARRDGFNVFKPSWDFSRLPKWMVPIRCKLICKRKIDLDGKMDTYKSKLVAKRYSQKEGIDYEKTFSKVVMIKSIRILLCDNHIPRL